MSSPTDNTAAIERLESEVSTTSGISRANSLIELAELLVPTEAARALGLAEEAHGLSESPIERVDELVRRDVLARAGLAMAAAYLALHRNQEAVDAASAARQLLEELDNPSGAAQACLTAGSALSALGRIDEAKAELQRGLDNQVSVDPRGDRMAALWAKLATANRLAGDAAAVLDCAQELMAIAKKRGDRGLEADAMRATSEVHWLRGETTEHARCAEKQVALARECGDRYREATGLSSLGLARCHLGDYPGALGDMERCLETWRELGNRSGCASQLANMAVTYHRMNASADGIPLAEEALAIVRDLGAPQEEISVLGVLSSLHGSVGDHAAASGSAGRAVETAKASGMLLLEASSWRLLGQAQLEAGDLDDALTSLRTALAAARRLGSQGIECTSLVNIAQVHLAKAQFGEALEVTGEAVSRARAHGDESLISTLHEIASEAHAGTGDFAQAFRELRTHHAAFKDMHQKQSERSLAQLRVLHDVADREAKLKEAMEATDRSETRASAVLDSLASGILVLDVEGNVLSMNESWADDSHPHLSTADRDLTIGGSYLECLSANRARLGTAAGELRSKLRSVLSGTESHFETEWCSTEPPSDRWTLVEVTPLDSPLGGAVIRRTDITAIKQAESAAEQHREELAHVTRVATLGELVASITHELKQPLTAILSNAQAAQRFLAAGTPDLNEVREILDDIVDDDRRAGGIIERLRSLIVGRSIEMQPLKVNDVLEEVLDLLRGHVLRRRVSLTTEFESSLPKIQGDRIHLQQVALNLISNAIDAMDGIDPEKRTLRIRTKRAARGQIHVEIDDSGVGLGEHAQEQLFEPFFTTKTHGMGMGLAIARSIIEAHQGRLSAEHLPTGGARFRLELPISDPSHAD